MSYFLTVEKRMGSRLALVFFCSLIKSDLPIICGASIAVDTYQGNSIPTYQFKYEQDIINYKSNIQTSIGNLELINTS